MDHLLSVSVLLAVVIVLRALLFHRLPKRTFVVLWYICLAKLFIFTPVKSSFSIYNLLPLGESNTPLSQPLAFSKNTMTITGSKASMTQTPVNVMGALLVIWLIAALILAVRLFGGHFLAVGKYRQALPFTQPWLETWRTNHASFRTIHIRQTDLVGSACTYGILRPVILLPRLASHSSREELSYILEHEYTHIKAFDILFKWGMAAALCLYWFHPLVWVMYFLSSRDLEFACDETVIRRMGSNCKKDYAYLLIHLEESKLKPLTLSTGFGQNPMKERIELIMKMKKTSIAGIALAATIIVGVTAAFATSANAASDASKESTEDSVILASGNNTNASEDKSSDKEATGEKTTNSDGSTTVSFKMDNGISEMLVTSEYEAVLNDDKSITLKEKKSGKDIVKLEASAE